ncbi:hypothetical protein OXI21_01180 [Ignatzschineria sp. RMDPL8A]|uniref:hypothetical protein n=1 Tax=Ignatzschineria sp. RMDPL8A TaxID=2999236 RepID=UPI0024466B33|nr:hypothetical protein [Ignatzschineria sp. RMDPL8A]MDG9729039.1 hypothetical protein [Ignatzschineria sp. RMDPL8A]
MADISFNVHNIIPVEIFGKFRRELSGLFGDKFLQDYNNRIPLFTDPADIAKLEAIYKNNPKIVDKSNFGLTHHSGPHGAYSSYVENILNLYLNHPDFAGQPDKQRTAIIDFQKVLMDELKTGVDFLRSDGSNEKIQVDKIAEYFEDKILTDENFKNNDGRLKLAEQRVIDYDRISQEKIHVTADTGKNNQIYSRETLNQLDRTASSETGGAELNDPALKGLLLLAKYLDRIMNKIEIMKKGSAFLLIGGIVLLITFKIFIFNISN